VQRRNFTLTPGLENDQYLPVISVRKVVDCEQENVFLLITDVSSEVSVTIRTSYSVSASNPLNMYLRSDCLLTRETIANKKTDVTYILHYAVYKLIHKL
jgi:hypothetical protein